MDGIRLRPGQRRKSIRRRKIVRQKHHFEQAHEMLTFAELGLKSESKIFAKKFKQLQYGNYPNQFTSIEIDHVREDSVKSVEVHSDSASSRGRASTVKSKDEYLDLYRDKTEIEIVKCCTDENLKVGGARTDDKPGELSDGNLTSPRVNIQDFRSLTVPFESVADYDLSRRDSATAHGVPIRRGSVLGPPKSVEFKEDKPRGKSACVSGVTLPKINVTSACRRQLELNTVSRKQSCGALESLDSDEMIENLQDSAYYRSEHVMNTSMSDISLDIAKTESIESSDSDSDIKFLTISDSDECNTDLEPDENFGRDPIPEADINIGRKVYTKACKKMGKPPQKYILKCLPQRSITLRNRSLGKNGIAPLCAALRDNLRVERLNLEGTDISDEGIQHVTDMLLENVCISHLNLANNSLGLRAAQLVSHVMITTKYLSHLNLSDNKLGDDEAWYIAAGMGANVSITHLDLGYNKFDEKGGVLLSSGLVRNTKIVYLSFRWNKICGKGAVAIFQAMMLNTSVEVLDFAWNGMSYDGAVALSKCLKTNTTLRTLDISSNRLEHRCSPLLAEGLRSNTTLKHLKVACNPLSTTGCMDILEAVATEESVVNFLDCSEIPVLGEADLLAATVSRRRKFQFIHGGIVPTHDRIGERLGRELNPMLRVIEYLRLLGLRPLELMKSFDKSASFELPRQEFVEQIKKIGVKLHTFEIEALANSISGKGYNKNVINYRKLSMAVREVVQAERDRKIREREEYLQMKKIHEKIMMKTQMEMGRTKSAGRGNTKRPHITGFLRKPRNYSLEQAAVTRFMEENRRSMQATDADSLKLTGPLTNSTTGISRDSISSKASFLTSRVNFSMCSPLDKPMSSMSIHVKKTKRTKKKKQGKK